MNRGEWGESYVALRLLGEQKLYLSDENGNPNLSEWMEVLKVIRKETNDRIVTYHCRRDSMDIDIDINDNYVTSIAPSEFIKMAETLKNDIVSAEGRSFNVSDEVIAFLSQAEILHMKAKSVEKSDIVLAARDPRSSIIREDIGFSIKCEFGENPTLFNTGKASAAKYKIQGMTPELMDSINAMVDKKNHAAVSDRCSAIRDNGCKMEFVGFEYASRAKCCAFQESLDQINPRLPFVIERMMWNHFMEGQPETDIVSVTEKIIEENPCDITIPENKYPYMVKLFLYAAYCGMTAGTVWHGENTVKGGYITVKSNGDIVANYALESEAFKNFLFTHCYLDFPSTDEAHGAYGKVYQEDGDYFFKLNFQIRLK